MCVFQALQCHTICHPSIVCVLRHGVCPFCHVPLGLRPQKNYTYLMGFVRLYTGLLLAQLKAMWIGLVRFEPVFTPVKHDFNTRRHVIANLCPKSEAQMMPSDGIFLLPFCPYTCLVDSLRYVRAHLFTSASGSCTLCGSFVCFVYRRALYVV